MVGSPSSESSTRRWHRLIEHYTPDGTLGRLILAACVGTASATALFIAAIVTSAMAGLWFFLAPLAAGFGLAAGLLAIVTLWPVYLSLIGNVESPRAYMKAGTHSASDSFDTGTIQSFASSDSEDAVANLKRQYAAGDISEKELDERVENLLHVDEVASRASEERRYESKNAGRQKERN
ncbi:SHOCT domain-containing protein [Halorussus halophilus]|uniref:SHOCT domain-containing protein n=1 Tax=Halorussus halophilus TaxID=2650975 RepID=UPI001300DB9C|nr:SHOCT domain-containing protein [Halorussus halophilus]